MESGIIILIVSLCLISMSMHQLKEKGILINNVYIWADKEERQMMSEEYKKPYYRQSGICFMLLGLVFFSLFLSISLKINWLIYVSYLLVGLVIIYALVSSITISKKCKGE